MCALLVELVGTQVLPVSTHVLDLVLVLRQEVLLELLFYLPVTGVKPSPANGFMLTSTAWVAVAVLETTLVGSDIKTFDNRCDLATATTVGIQGMERCFSDDCGDRGVPGRGIHLESSVLFGGELDLDLLHGLHDAWRRGIKRKTSRQAGFCAPLDIRMFSLNASNRKSVLHFLEI